NAGHFDVEIDKKALEKSAIKKRKVRPYVEEFTLTGGKHIYLLAEARLVNLVAGQGHPVEIMDLSFAIQALCAQQIAAEGHNMRAGVYRVPEEIDRKVAWLKLEIMGIEIDKLTEKQQRYIASWREGT
ncbi:MAG: adenosylhomocysteinase, partial [Thermoplasmata archaeon]